jgi:hypothetical protein
VEELDRAKEDTMSLRIVRLGSERVPGEGLVKSGLAALSDTAHFSVGCYCSDEARCHRPVLRELPTERGAKIV